MSNEIKNLEIKVQNRGVVGQKGTSFSDLLIMEKKPTKKEDFVYIQIKDAVRLCFVCDIKNNGSKCRLDFIQGQPLLVELENKSIVQINSLSALDDGLFCVLEDGEIEELLLTPNIDELGKLYVSDGDSWDVKIEKWSNKDGHTEVKKIIAPSVRGVSYGAVEKKKNKS